MFLSQRLAGSALAAVAILAGTALTVEAQPRRDFGFVTAYSRYSGDSISAPVRQGPYGQMQVRLPGGTWLDCGRSCRDTLRRETVDFWGSRDRFNGQSDGPGYLHRSW